VTIPHPATLNVALIKHHHRAEDDLEALMLGLEELGHRVDVLSSRGLRVPERLLSARGFAGPLTQIPATIYALARGNYDVAHTFSAVDAVPALHWSRSARRPVVFTCADPLSRETVADGRLRLHFLTRAVESSDAVTVPTEAARLAVWRWLAVEAIVVDPRDGAAHEDLYRRLLGHSPPER
jgi:hypothetical protein